VRTIAWTFVAVAVVVACGHPAPPRPPPSELAVKLPADIAGTWVTSDDSDWGYRLTIDKAGALAQVVDRGKMGRCEQKGTLVVDEATPKQFQITYDKNECNRDYNGAALQIKVASFTGEMLTLVVTGYGSEERHVYKRAPAPAAQ
jgi:hypothetical protein